MRQFLLPPLFVAVWISMAPAQDIEKVLPKTLPAKAAAAKVVESAPPKGEGGSEVLIQHLRGIRFVAGTRIVPEGVAAFSGIRAEGLPFLQDPEFQSQLASAFLGKPVTVDTLGLLSQAALQQYRINDRPVVDVVVPEQDVTSEVLQVAVVEGHVHEVKTEGNKWFSGPLLASRTDLKPGDAISERKLVGNLNVLNQNPFHSTNVELAPGPEAGTTDIILTTQDRFPARFYTGYDNTGNLVTGQDRYNFGFNYGNLFGLDQQFNYQFTADNTFNRFQAHAASYVVPLPWHHTLNFFGGYIDSLGHPSGANLTGVSWQASARYNAGLPSVGGYTQGMSGGYDFKESNNNLDAGGTSVYNTNTDVSQFVLGYTGSLRDAWGVTNVSLNLYGSPGGMVSHDRNADYQVPRSGAHANYAYGQIGLDRTTRLPGDFSWLTRGIYQDATSNLLGSEQFGLGGSDTVRGYLEREANGDVGWLLSNELRTPAVSLSALFAPKFGTNIANDQLQFLVFWDYGWTRSLHLLSGEDPNVYLSSVGPGFRYTIGQYVSVKFDYGFQLTDTGLGDPNNSYGHLSVTISY